MARKKSQAENEGKQLEILGAAEALSAHESSASAVRAISDEPPELVFRFEVGPAILAQLLVKLSRLEQLPVEEGFKAKYPGFYQLFHKGEPVYIGKASRPVGKRLQEHADKLGGRAGIKLEEITCKFVYVEDPSLIDVAEGALIAFFRARGMAAWNGTGLGSKVTGYGRGGQRQSKWSKLFPPETSRAVTAGALDPITPAELFEQLEAVAPLPFKLPTAFRTAFAEEHTDELSVPPNELPFEDWVVILERLLAPGWNVEREAEGWYVSKPKKGV